MKIAITGASGFVGRALQKCFDDTVTIRREDDEAAILARSHRPDGNAYTTLNIYKSLK
ncbi:hypothetical protein [Sulfurovum sp.]|jgi:nucleoside-diphosphate-sugar epimerase|uniref:hypothetical protein n=1 Tax=Sulfurovum sp. TaxID=1969726 RepID=UPI002A368668|nr:hypothetical protein [Sulfurovum sp.]MDY0403913.1 hypothetical protein [Sulfurovum sp.]